MGRCKQTGLWLLVSFVAAFGVANAALAGWSEHFQSSEESVMLSKDSVHKGSFYATSSQVTINGTITGSLYCLGSEVTLNGTVEGDVLCAAQKITINGSVGQDARVAAQFVEIAGGIGGSLTAFGQDVRIAKDATIADDINGAAQQLTVDGAVGRDMAVGTQLLALNGQVAGSVDAATEKVQLGDGALITGNLNYSSQKQQEIDESKVQGSVSYNAPKEADSPTNRQFISATALMFGLMLAVSALTVALVIPRFLHRSAGLFTKQMLSTGLVGFAFVFGGPIAVMMMLLSVVLVPVALMLLFGWLVVILLSGIFFAYWVGSELLKSQQNTLVRMLGGIAVVLVLYIIPFVNAFVILAALVVGSGMVLTTLTSGYRRPRYRISDVSD